MKEDESATLAVFEGVPLDEESLKGHDDGDHDKTYRTYRYATAAQVKRKREETFAWMCAMCVLLYVAVQISNGPQQSPPKRMPLVTRQRHEIERLGNARTKSAMRQKQLLETKSLATMDIENGIIPKLTKETYDTFLANNQHVIILFYTPWCQICQREAPMWEEFGERVSLPEEGLPVGVARVECADQIGDICRKNGIMAYPTIRWIDQGGSKATDFFGYRSVDNFVLFSRGMLGLPSGGVPILTEGSFDDFLAQNQYAFIFFYALWNDFSTLFAPAWEEFAEQVAQKDDMPVGVAQVDCTAQQEVCSKNGISMPHHPTVRWFKRGQRDEDYQGTHTAHAFMDYTLKKLLREQQHE